MIERTAHEKFMQRCIDLAKLGLGNTAPNPLVGSVIVYNNQIIGEGFHRNYGEAHAEVNAINSVKDKSLLKRSTIYVNLEPCSHHGKTPPCANLIASMAIPQIVIGSKDTAAHVSGNGIKILQKTGSKVLVGVLEKESRELNKRFFTFHEKKRPYIILKWAQTKDAFIDIKRDSSSLVQPTWITNEYAKALVHKWRSEEQAILIGTNTALLDDPTLTTRNWTGKNPIRIVLDQNLKLPKDLKVFNNQANTFIIADKTQQNRKIKYENNIGIRFADYKKDFYAKLFKILIDMEIQSVIIEGGEKVLNSFIKNDLLDEARIFTGDIEFGDGVKAPALSLKNEQIDLLGDSSLTFITK
ncbi:MAG: bifunctional diaminohydroxyphosphoribosylaminopyrimidine deaminase/5-amino-6-(5-phosphoribosylamino)uracil reductase RibD [Marinilabiliales bacterium]|nr:MAG: bifunctional diaminohydroxyphosphoribosylaminopyrimidine deaminase/5-amino-6-(5-phosphoribosylamino)uracil reductase RibD [Marinilabiliales bacterium]